MSYYVPVTAWVPAYSWSLCVLPYYPSLLPPLCSGGNGVSLLFRTHFYAFLCPPP